MGPRILAIANQKGGVGKTTTALSLGGALSRMGRRVLVMDLDPHACASIHLRCYPEKLEHTSFELFMADPDGWKILWPKAVRSGEDLLFDFIPGSIRLSELEMALGQQQSKGQILSSMLQQEAVDYDYVLLDSPPHVGVVLVNSLVCADLVIIPIQTDFLALHGLKLLFDTIRTLNRVLPEPVQYKALATMFDRRTGACKRVLQLLRQKLEDKMFDTVIGIDTKFRDASAHGKVIYQIFPKSRGAGEYEKLAKEIESA